MPQGAKEQTVYGAFSAFFAVVSGYLGIVVVPITVLLVVMIIDYITGMVAAWHEAELSSKKGIFGIVKKLCYIFAVTVGIGVDWLIYSGLQSMNVSLGVSTFFGLLVTFWLIINELISILENLSKIGIPLPNFLKTIVNRLKTTTEKIGNKDKTEGEEKDEKGN